MTKLYPDMMADVIMLMAKEQPELVRTEPGWPAFDIVREAYRSIEVAAENLDRAVKEDDVAVVALAITHMVKTLLVLSTTIGVDLRPVWTAVQRSNMEGTKLVNIRSLLMLQGDITEDIQSGIPAEEEPKVEEEVRADA